MEKYLPELEQIIFRSRRDEEGAATDQKLASIDIIKFLVLKGVVPGPEEVVYLKVA